MTITTLPGLDEHGLCTSCGKRPDETGTCRCNAPFCECGCGERVLSSRNGIWSRWRSGHNRRTQRSGSDRNSPLAGVGIPPVPTSASALTPGQLTFFD